MNYPPPLLAAGKQPKASFDPTGKTLLVNEIFYSLQGEGLRTGRPTLFIRLAKCNMACPWCDTEFEKFKVMNLQHIIEEAIACIHTTEDNYTSHANVMVDITGGEPMLQNFAPLVQALREAGFGNIGIETSGTVWNEAARTVDWVTLSPKAGLLRVPSQLLGIADEVKWVVDDNFCQTYKKAPQRLYVPGILNFLQPESCRKPMMKFATLLCLWHPERYRLSLQTHKVAGNR